MRIFLVKNPRNGIKMTMDLNGPYVKEKIEEKGGVVKKLLTQDGKKTWTFRNGDVWVITPVHL